MLRILHASPGITAAECPPTRRSITVSGDRFFLKWPHMVFVLEMQRLFVYAAPKAVMGRDCPVYIPPLPNVNDNGVVCLGIDMIGNDIRPYIRRFWTSDFVESELRKGFWYNDHATAWRGGEYFFHWGRVGAIGEIHPLPRTFPGFNKDAISDRARTIWMAQGMPQGRDDAIWLEAEQDILAYLYTKE